MFFLIDGYNLLRAVQKDDQYCNFDDAELCHSLSEFLHRNRQRAMIIFDGVGPRDKTHLRGHRNLSIHFVGADSDADTEIEGRIEMHANPKKLAVVSDDRRLRDAAGAGGAVSVRCQFFWQVVEAGIAGKAPVREPKEKRSGISGSEANAWLDTFGID